MENLLVCSSLIPSDSKPYEIVERKGIGHPDTLADGLAEALSSDYSLYCLREFGVILHHSFDKTMLIGGQSEVGFGIGKMLRPIRLIIGGKASASFGGEDVDFKEILEVSAKKYLGNVLPNMDVERWLEILYNFFISAILNLGGTLPLILSIMDKPTFFQLEGSVASMIPKPDGGVRVSVAPGFSIADFMERGERISKEEYDKAFALEVARLKKKS